MDIAELNKQIEKLDLKSTKKEAILNLIEIKTTGNMEEVIKEIRVLKSDIDSKFATMDSKFAIMDSKFVSLRSDMLTNRWVIAIIGAVVAIVTALSRIL